MCLLGVPGGGEVLPFDKFLMKFTYESPADGKVKESGLGDTVKLDEDGKPVLDMDHVRKIEKTIFGHMGMDSTGKVRPKGKVKTVRPQPKKVRPRETRASMTRNPKKG